MIEKDIHIIGILQFLNSIFSFVNERTKHIQHQLEIFSLVVSNTIGDDNVCITTFPNNITH